MVEREREREDGEMTATTGRLIGASPWMSRGIGGEDEKNEREKGSGNGWAKLAHMEGPY